jgi:hypothetical protein
MRLYAKMPLAPSRTHQQVQDGYGDHISDLAEMTVNKASCFVCGKGASCGLKACSKCKEVKYCSRACQIQHWKHQGHREECGTKNVLKYTTMFGVSNVLCL